MLTEYAKKTEIIGADMHGKTVRSFNFPGKGFLLMGSESHGISEALQQYLTYKVTIERKGNAESLNVAVATGILVNQFVNG